MNVARRFPSVLPTIFIVGLSCLMSACGAGLPAAAPLSTPSPHPMTRTRPSSARAVEPGSDDHPSVESEGPPPDDDDDDGDGDGDDSTGTPKSRPDTRNLLSK